MTVEITNPSNNSRFQLRQSVTFKGTASENVVRVELVADNRYDLGSDMVDSQGVWSITYPGFNQAGTRQISAVGFDGSDTQREVDTINILLANASGSELGIDVSDYDATVNWQRVIGAGYIFAIAKATEEINWRARTFPNNWYGIKAVGMIRGAYHFFRPTFNARQQAEHFLNYVGEIENDDLPPALDLEHYPEYVAREWASISKNERIARVKTWIEVVEERTRRKPIIYTSWGFWDGYMSGVREFSQYPLWVANYTTRAQPLIPPQWSKWTFWQYTDKGEVPGINQEDEDLDRFNGSYDELLDFIRGTIII